MDEQEKILLNQVYRVNWFWNIYNKTNDSTEMLTSLLSRLTKRLLLVFLDTLDEASLPFNASIEERRTFLVFRKTVYKMANLCFDSRGLIFPEAVITEWTWSIIYQTQGSKEVLRTILFKMTKEEIHRFFLEVRSAANSLYQDLFIQNLRYISEDGLEDLTWWVVTQGKEYYYSVWKNPKTFPESKPRKSVSFLGVADDIYEEKFGESINDFT